MAQAPLGHAQGRRRRAGLRVGGAPPKAGRGFLTGVWKEAFNCQNHGFYSSHDEELQTLRNAKRACAAIIVGLGPHFSVLSWLSEIIQGSFRVRGSVKAS